MTVDSTTTVTESGIPVSSLAPREGQASSSSRPGQKAARRPTAYNDLSYHPGSSVTVYCPPQQRQKWGDTQVLPRTNYADLFLDLFYVGAAYNSANILVNDPTGKGLLYFFGTFFPMAELWKDKQFYDARFVIGDDLFHRLFETVAFLVAATGILHIRSVDAMSHPREHVDMFGFCLGQVMACALHFFAYLEVYLFGRGQRLVIRKTAIRDATSKLIPFCLYMAAAIISGIEYFQNGAGSSNARRMLAAAEPDNDAKESAAAYASGFATDTPIWLCLFGAVTAFLYIVVRIQFLFPRDGSHKKFTVPMNIDFSLHRNGEWIMLMLGESVLSLLIVEVSGGSDYFTTFFCGLLTVILLQYFHFRSQPHSPDHHAMRRNKDAGVWWSFFNGVYSAALVMVGASFKLFLTEFLYDEADEDHRELWWMEPEDEERLLAGGGGAASTMSTEERQQNMAHLFCGAMAAVWFCSDVMILLHLGLKDSMGRCRCEETKKIKTYKGIILLFLRVCLTVFIATLSQYETDPDTLAVVGLVGVALQLCLRRLGGVYFPQPSHHHHESGHGGEDGSHDQDQEIDPEEYKWPNATHAVALHDASQKKLAEDK